jgi:uncharacterized protein YeaO (DUF488 family)
MPVTTKCIYDPPSTSDGCRALVMQYWPRGVRKDKVNVWIRELGTPPDLIAEWKAGDIAWAQFAKRYKEAMRGRRDEIAALARLASKGRVTLLCGCRDESRCHRIILKELVEKAGRAPRPEPALSRSK